MGIIVAILIVLVVLFVIKSITDMKEEDKLYKGDYSALKPDESVGMFWRESDEPFHYYNLYKRDLTLSRIGELVNNGFTILLSHGDDDDTKFEEHVAFRSKGKQIGLYHNGKLFFNLYDRQFEKIKSKGYRIFLFH